jgi:hypothetical protein
MIGQFFRVASLLVIFLCSVAMGATNTPHILTSVLLTALVLVSFCDLFYSDDHRVCARSSQSSRNLCRQLLRRLDLPRLGRSAGVVGDAGRTTYRLINQSQKEQYQ